MGENLAALTPALSGLEWHIRGFLSVLLFFFGLHSNVPNMYLSG